MILVKGSVRTAYTALVIPAQSRSADARTHPFDCSLRPGEQELLYLSAFASFYLFRHLLDTALGVASFEFWFMMQIAVLCGFATSYPANSPGAINRRSLVMRSTWPPADHVGIVPDKPASRQVSGTVEKGRKAAVAAVLVLRPVRSR